MRPGAFGVPGQEQAMSWYRLALLPVVACAVLGTVVGAVLGWMTALDVDVDI